jgi:YwqJ-like deaminase
MAGAAKNAETEGDPSVATNKEATAANKNGEMTQLMRDRIATQERILKTNRRLVNEGKTPEQIARMSDAEMRAELAKDGVASEVQGMDTAQQLRNTNQRVQRFNDESPLTEKDWQGMQDEIGNHGEVKAVDAELQKIEAAEGRPATPEDLQKLTLHNTKVPKQGEPVTDEAMPRCQHCQGLLKGVKVTPELAAAEQSMAAGAQEPVSGGKGPPLAPFTPPGENDGGDGGSGGAANSGGGGEEGASGVDSLFDD